MEPRDLILASATASAQLVGTQLFYKLTEHTLKFTWADLAQNLTAQDRPGLLCPIDLEKDGKDRQGAILALPGRAIIVWAVGLRMKTFDAVVATSTITSFDRTIRSGGWASTDRERLTVFADGQAWSMVFANVFEGGRSIVPFIQPALNGAITPIFDPASTAPQPMNSEPQP